jgi:hypothetical protein
MDSTLMSNEKHEHDQLVSQSVEGNDREANRCRKSILQLALLASLVSVGALLGAGEELAGPILFFITIPLVLEILSA